MPDHIFTKEIAGIKETVAEIFPVVRLTEDNWAAKEALKNKLVEKKRSYREKGYGIRKKIHIPPGSSVRRTQNRGVTSKKSASGKAKVTPPRSSNSLKSRARSSKKTTRRDDNSTGEEEIKRTSHIGDKKNSGRGPANHKIQDREIIRDEEESLTEESGHGDVANKFSRGIHNDSSEFDYSIEDMGDGVSDKHERQRRNEPSDDEEDERLKKKAKKPTPKKRVRKASQPQKRKTRKPKR